MCVCASYVPGQANPFASSHANNLMAPHNVRCKILFNTPTHTHIQRHTQDTPTHTHTPTHTKTLICKSKKHWDATKVKKKQLKDISCCAFITHNLNGKRHHAHTHAYAHATPHAPLSAFVTHSRPQFCRCLICL